MKVVAVIGSSHKNGPSAEITKAVLRGAKDAGHETVVYNINDMNVRGCQGCGYCKNNNADCIIDDDLKPYWKDLHEAGALIVSAPNYAAQVCGPMITYMNRHYCLIAGPNAEKRVRVHPGIKLIGIFAQGNGNKEAYMQQYKWFLGDFENRDMELQDIIVHTRQEPYGEDSDIIRRAYEAGKAL